MKIELWSDYASPYCYIGEKRLEEAMKSINEKYAISGAQGAELINEALVKVLAEERQKNIINIDDSEGMVCGPDGCHLSSD